MNWMSQRESSGRGRDVVVLVVLGLGSATRCRFRPGGTTTAATGGGGGRCIGAAAGSASPRSRSETPDAVGAGVGQEAEVVVVDLGGGRAEGAGGVGLGAEDRADLLGVDPAGEVGPKLGAGLVAVVGVLRHQLADDRGERRRDAPGHPFERLGVFHPLLEDLVNQVAPLERGAAGEGEIERAAEAVKVAPAVGRRGVARAVRGWRNRACRRRRWGGSAASPRPTSPRRGRGRGRGCGRRRRA